MRISDWSSDVCSSDLAAAVERVAQLHRRTVAFEQRDRCVVVGLRVRVAVEPDQHRPARAEQACAAPRVVARRVAVEQVAELGRASCSDNMCQYLSISVVACSFKKQSNKYPIYT